MGISNLSSSLIRGCLKIFFREGKFYRMQFGALKGFKSYYRKDINFRTLMGLWETDSLKILDRAIKNFGLDKKNIIVADVGANLGYYTMFFAKKLTAQSRIYAFEPSDSILDVLKKNIRKNKLGNAEIVEMACSDKSGTVEFYLGQNHHTSSMLGTWAENTETGTLIRVNAISIDEFFGNEKIAAFPDIIKMDIEGAGVFALKGCDRCLKIKRPLILMESHTPAEDEAIGNVLNKYNYEAFRINDLKWVAHKDKNYLDPLGVWGTMLMIPAEKKQVFKN